MSFFIKEHCAMNIELSEENKASKVAAVFESEQQALDARQILLNDDDLNQLNFEIVRPKDKHISEKIEPESKAIIKFITRSHWVLGGLGLVIGLVVASALALIGPEMTQSSPMYTYLAFAIIGTFLGLLIAGVVSLRPDHDPLITQTMTASQQNQWTLIIQTEDQEKLTKVYEMMESISASVTKTL